ncbi:MAG: cytochrome b/b6 domain-containing protein [Candidatus Electronema sp. V4]|uniref:cytochrome b/b6 domain-containing protein n=1 Tax=Candidatus Electronema sp. V4 TaxID=3454756 RepID=UPI0040555F47
MNNPDAAQNDNGRLAPPVRFWHLAIIILVLAALFTGEGADDYKKAEHAGFLLHGKIGISVFFALCLYFVYSFFGPQEFRLPRWFPFTGERLRQTGRDLKMLASFKLPEHKRRQGLAGLVQFFGIMVFSWLAATGTVMYFFLEPGSRASGLLHAVKEAHEVAVVLIPVYLALHVGAVIAHSLSGHQVWREIFFLKNSAEQH